MEKQLLPHQQRVVDEYNELTERKQKLFEFIEVKNDIFDSLPFCEKQDLKKQWVAMSQYAICLESRISRF